MGSKNRSTSELLGEFVSSKMGGGIPDGREYLLTKVREQASLKSSTCTYASVSHCPVHNYNAL